MRGNPPHVMNHLKFLERTTIGRKLGGRELGKIVQVLRSYDLAIGARPEQRVSMLQDVIDQCRTWLQLKSGKLSDVTAKRAIVVRELANQAFNRMRYELFQTRKLKLAKTGQGFAGGSKGKSLSGPYQAEHLQYTEHNKKSLFGHSKKVHPIHTSQVEKATWDEGLQQQLLKVAGNNSHFRDAIAILSGPEKELSKLTVSEYQQIADLLKLLGNTSTVLYMSKAERISHLLIIEQSKFCKDLNDESIYEPYSTTPNGSTFAMDKYGNFFCGRDKAFTGSPVDLDPASFAEATSRSALNHSSYNRGKDVICAGNVVIEHGVLKQIDNGSGHYKPDQQNLIDCLKILKNEGLDLTSATAEWWVGPGPTDMKSGKATSIIP